MSVYYTMYLGKLFPEGEVIFLHCPIEETHYGRQDGNETTNTPLHSAPWKKQDTCCIHGIYFTQPARHLETSAHARTAPHIPKMQRRRVDGPRSIAHCPCEMCLHTDPLHERTVISRAQGKGLDFFGFFFVLGDLSLLNIRRHCCAA